MEGGNGRWGRGTEGRMRLYLIFVCVIKRTASKAYNTITESPWLLLVEGVKGKEALHVVFLNFERGLSFRGLSF